jgi:sarcosine oxidase subunit beta
VVIFDWPQEIGRERRHRVVIDSTQNSWLRPYGAAGTLIGAETGDRRANPDELPPDVPQSYVERARAALAARFPAFKAATAQLAWTGCYMRSPDSHPIIDRLPQFDGLFLFTGDSGTSFKTSPAIGICLAEWILDGAPRSVDLSPFRASRFAEGKPWVDEHQYDEGSALTIAR